MKVLHPSTKKKIIIIKTDPEEPEPLNGSVNVCSRGKRTIMTDKLSDRNAIIMLLQ